MYFLLVYDRNKRSLSVLHSFPLDQGEAALNERIAFELEHAGNPDVEVVLLTSESEEALRKTHSRYFKTWKELTS